MATRDVVLAPDAARRRDLHLSPLDKVQGFFDALSDLRQTTDSSSSNDKTRSVSGVTHFVDHFFGIIILTHDYTGLSCRHNSYNVERGFHFLSPILTGCTYV